VKFRNIITDLDQQFLSLEITKQLCGTEGLKEYAFHLTRSFLNVSYDLNSGIS